MRAGLLPTLVLAAACDPGGFRPIDPVTTHDLLAVSVTADGQALISGEAGTILDLSGTTVVLTSTDTDPGPAVPNLYAAARAGERRFVGGDGGTLLVSEDGGDYLRDTAPGTARLLTMVRAGDGELLAGGESGTVLRRAPDGPGWSRVDIGAPRTARITGGWGASDYAVLTSDLGLIFERTQGAWVAQTVLANTSTVPLFDAWQASPASDLIAVGLGGQIFRRAPDLTWTADASPTTQDLYGVFGTAPDRVFAVGANGTVLRYDGATWSPAPAGTSQDLFGIDGTEDGRLTVAVGRRGTIITLEGE